MKALAGLKCQAYTITFTAGKGVYTGSKEVFSKDVKGTTVCTEMWDEDQSRAEKGQ
ncbi:hypothetical protein [Pseudomonas phage vB_PaeM_PAO1_Ab17]|uniref:Uncharacterized protein n=4 Tax=Nankokuvirus Ab03 TaxID=1925780 RepID=A0A0A1IWT2_9CAUD|nr:hypothetical protein VC54_gp028 [Pseudomonas phage vB_PaeM_PAO1_Ab03]CEF89133.1 hypothetical protein [Pseudomonas phage vB_PaeM_PAO1_Ab03]CEF89517.1 hypothetical protein [Pseudomonas phage vB_PaeM_PAO1_Ab17]CEQ38305.1 hypothetical protein [Pseudomonas phage vB_PaeM_PAO1_Ab04]CEQ38337.1 hypothetical protein [Pseudomonas phage vB_PaeM_PAO1_Ab06]